MDTETAKSLKIDDRVKYVNNSGNIILGKVESVGTEKVQFLWDDGDRDCFDFDKDLPVSSVQHIAHTSPALSQIRRASEMV